ncbi:hypothetical protein GT360_19420 [Vibrio astriarenae]|uniref:DUF3316 domain-containing protein n=1 Tax=Vibrio astriarenae TaxID=1481923 RepID=A0A7Z2T7H8_9VIBR|nr:hypothetical protein [Vibrio astriarenae]QIA65695.1 hypothetical protein GT360_19420 [Vibrio astriarenae]
MKKTLLTLSLALVATGAMAHSKVDPEIQDVYNDLAQLATVQEQGEAVMTVDQDFNLEKVDYVGFLTEKEVFITKKEAKENGLGKVKHHYITTTPGEDLGDLEVKLMTYIETDQPNYFSVDIFRNYHGDSGNFNYIAKVVEYS